MRSGTVTAVRRDEVEALVRRQAAAWTAGDAHAAAADFAEDGVLISPGGAWRGPEGVRRGVRAFLDTAAVVRIEVRRVLVDGDEAAVEWVWTERRHADGAVVTMEDAIVVGLRDGRITYWREYFDPAQTATTDVTAR